MELEPVSATDLKCVWSQKKQSALEQYKAVPLMETDCLKEQGSGNIVVENLSTEDADNLRLRFETCVPHSALMKHRLGRRRIHDGDISYQIDNSGFECVLDNSVQSVIMMELSSNMSDIYMNNCCKINYNSLFFDDTISICVETKNSDIEWKKQRQFRITGSRCYAIFTYNKNDWYKKALSYFWPKEFTNVYVKHGFVFEEKARNRYIYETGSIIKRTGLVVPHNNPWLGFSPDGVIVENNVPIKLLEIKCPFIGKQKPIRDCLENLAYLEKGTWNLKKKHIYFGQVQLGMAILNLFSCDFVLYSSFDESLFIINVPFDEPFCQQMLAKLQQNFFLKMFHVICENKNKSV